MTNDAVSENENSLNMAVPEKTVYSLKESIFALVFSFSGYFFLKTVFASGGIGSAIFLTVLCGCSMAFAVLSKAKQSRYSNVYFAAAVIFSLNTGISGNLLIQFLNALFAAMMYAMWAFALNNPSYKGADDSILYCLANAFFGQTFGNIGKCPAAVFSLTKRNKAGQNIRNALIGLIVAAPVTLVVISLLSSADDNFNDIMNKIFDSIINNFFKNSFLYILALPLSFLVFGAVYGAVKNTKESRIDKEACHGITLSARIVPAMALYASAVPLCIVYIIFFFSQLSYFTSAFSGVLPEGFIASEYARKGFFELCTVAVINLAVIIALNLLCRFEEKRPAVLKFFTSLMSVFTLILIATAFSKMAMYIQRFGLTQLRVYTSWFMVLLAVLFILVIIRQFKKINLARIGAVVFTIMLTFLSFAQTDSLIAKYNLEMYRSNQFDSEVLSMSELSADGIYTAVEMLESGDETEYEEAADFVADSLDEIKRVPWYRYSVSDIAVKNTAEKYGIEI